jgi:hypothetical protein
MEIQLEIRGKIPELALSSLNLTYLFAPLQNYISSSTSLSLSKWCSTHLSSAYIKLLNDRAEIGKDAEQWRKPRVH